MERGCGAAHGRRLSILGNSRGEDAERVGKLHEASRRQPSVLPRTVAGPQVSPTPGSASTAGYSRMDDSKGSSINWTSKDAWSTFVLAPAFVSYVPITPR